MPPGAGELEPAARACLQELGWLGGSSQLLHLLPGVSCGSGGGQARVATEACGSTRGCWFLAPPWQPNRKLLQKWKLRRVICWDKPGSLGSNPAVAGEPTPHPTHRALVGFPPILPRRLPAPVWTCSSHPSPGHVVYSGPQTFVSGVRKGEKCCPSSLGGNKGIHPSPLRDAGG